MKLSEHLSLAEVIRSDVAKRAGISNMPTAEHLNALKALAKNVFEPLRLHFDVPIYISSGYRSAELNKKVKGSSSSQHIKGEAIDIDMDGSGDGITNANVFFYIKDNLPYDQLIWEGGNDKSPNWVHVSYSTSRMRKQVLRMKKVGGKSVYTQF